MTLSQFERNLKKIKPSLHLRQRGQMDVVGLFDGSKYLMRLNRGELNLNGFRMKYFTDSLETKMGPIQKRGRKTILSTLMRGGYIKNHEQRNLLLWGVS